MHRLGQEPAASLAPRDARAADVSALTAAALPAAESLQSRQQPADQGSQAAPTVPATVPPSVAAAAAAQQPATVSHPDAAELSSRQHGGVIDGVLKQELQQLQDSYLLLQEEYWRQKDRLMALEIEAGQLRVSTEQAQATAAQVRLQACC